MTMLARNALCPCGSGKKYKLCCLSATTRAEAAPPGAVAPEQPDPRTAYQTALAAYGAADLVTVEASCALIPANDVLFPQALNLRGMAAHARGDFSRAAILFGQAVAHLPAAPEFHHNLGSAFQVLGRFGEAQASLEEALRLRPGFAQAHNSLGNVRQSLGRPAEAISCYEAALRLEPLFGEARYNWGNALAALNRHDEAIAQFLHVLALQPQHTETHGSLGAAYLVLGRGEEAIRAYQEAIRRNPWRAEYLYGLGNAYQALALIEEAIDAYQAAINVQPTFAPAYHNLGYIHQMRGRYAEAAVNYERARDLEPRRPEPRANLARVYLALERFAEAQAEAAGAMEVDPRYGPGAEALFQVSRTLCAWEGLEAASTRYRNAIVRELNAGGRTESSPFTAFWLPLPPLEQRALAESTSAGIAAPLAGSRAGLPPAPQRAPGQRLRIGYLSSDYRAHATAHLLGHLFALHDRSRFEAIAYSTGPDDGSAYRRRFEREAERFVDMASWSPVQAALRIRTDGVDILVDLHGHTTGGSLATLAMHPAPVQVHFLGYPGTVGRDLVDVILLDPVVCPPEHESYYSERVYRLPDTYQLNDRQPIGPIRPRATHGLPDMGFVFCCFNAAYKITPEIFALWLRILDRAPGSVLWLYGGKDAVVQNLRAEARRLGYPSERLIFGSSLPKDQHLARLGHADLMLDTPVVNAMTTASDALWAGVPVLSILGDSFPSRAGASILTAIGLPELIMPDLAAYEETAVRLATHHEEMAALKAKLAANRLTNPLFDTGRFIRNLETAYEELWARHISDADRANLTAPALSH
jgi:predicted O-linked N-acetylglucosamine transferase (SPINDLY family)